MPFSGVDETLNCQDCKQPFVFTAGEQKFYDSKGFADPPKRCKTCRDLRKADRQAKDAQGAPVPPKGAPSDDNYGNTWGNNEGASRKGDDGGRRRQRRQG